MGFKENVCRKRSARHCGKLEEFSPTESSDKAGTN
jgi:hypothetical protein